MPAPSELELTPDNTLILVVDVQDRLAPAMHERLFPRLVDNLARLGKAAEVLKIPVIMSEQYPKGLGRTIDPVREAFPTAAVLEKLSFDAAKDEAIARAIEETGRRKVIVTGMETHVCVYQTVRTLARDHSVHVLRDAVSSRTEENYEVGLELMRAAGGIVTSTEVVLFDLVQRAGTDDFRAISKLVR